MPAGRTATAILFYNKPAMTRRCLASVDRALARGPSPEGTVILVDNGSNETHDLFGINPGPDSVPEAARQIVRLGLNQGFARGMNAGLRAAFKHESTEWTLLLSNDVELPEDFYETLERALVQSPSEPPAILCPSVYFLSDRAKPSYTHGRVDPATGALSHHFYDGESASKTLRFPDYYPAAATLWSRAAFERLGGFDERYFCYWEDVELSHRCSRLGIELRCAPLLKVHHLGRGTTGGKRAYSEHFRRGQELTMALLTSDLVQ